MKTGFFVSIAATAIVVAAVSLAPVSAAGQTPGPRRRAMDSAADLRTASPISRDIGLRGDQRRGLPRFQPIPSKAAISTMWPRRPSSVREWL